MDVFDDVVVVTKELLKTNPEWKERYADYAVRLLEKQDEIKANKKLFRQPPPLGVYMNVTSAMGSGIFGLRYLGQQVADIKVTDEKVRVSTSNYDESNERDFECATKLQDEEWDGALAKKFRKYFSSYPVRGADALRRNEKHRKVSELLTELGKKESADKLIVGIQPVKIAGGVAKFSMPTPLGTSGKYIEYCGASGGGIDILARQKSGKTANLAIIEIKTENTAATAQKGINQAIAYAVFIRDLLRSPCGADWYKIFGFKSPLPKQLSLTAIVALPKSASKTTNFESTKISLGKDDILTLNSIYF